MLDVNRLKNINLIVFDIDGTLINDKGEIGKKTKQLVKELKKSGVMFSFASGRLHSALMPIAEELNIRIPLISLDGTVIKSNISKEFVYRSFLKQKHVIKAIELSEKFLINVALCHAEAIYYTEANSVIPQLMDKYGAVYKEVKSYDDYTKQTLEIVFAGDNKRAVEYLRDKFSFPFTFGCSISFFKSHTYDEIYYLEIRKSGSSKGKALLRLVRNLKTKIENTAVIGDWYNDISLFETGALKVALKNSVAELKHKADIVLKKTNNDDGVSEFLETLLKAKNKK
ncbi:MAG: Cof-type HAD-IIB family hydrolase [Ignavibacteriaceae bacterium]